MIWIYECGSVKAKNGIARVASEPRFLPVWRMRKKWLQCDKREYVIIDLQMIILRPLWAGLALLVVSSFFMNSVGLAVALLVLLIDRLFYMGFFFLWIFNRRAKKDGFNGLKYRVIEDLVREMVRCESVAIYDVPNNRKPAS